MRCRDHASSSTGFTLIELMAAMLIFTLMATTVLVNLDVATDLALDSVRARELRVLGERKLGEIEVFERDFDDIYDDEDFGDYGELWEEWKWSLHIRDVVIFGTTSDEAAEYLFGDPDEEEDVVEDEGAASGNQNEGETQFLRELTLTVRSPSGDTGESDSVTIVTFLPLVDHGAAAAPAGANPAGGN